MVETAIVANTKSEAAKINLTRFRWFRYLSHFLLTETLLFLSGSEGFGSIQQGTLERSLMPCILRGVWTGSLKR